MHSWRRLLLGAFAAVLTAGLVAGVPAANAIGNPDVKMRDNSSDTGAEPSSGPVWSSPDIRVCDTPSYCAADVEVTPGLTYYVFVTLNNTGERETSGRLHLYYTEAGGNATWPTDWVAINTPVADTVLAPGVNPPIMIPWTLPGDWVHFCLLARWVSKTDPMPVEGPSTVTNTSASNNIVWHNVVTHGPFDPGDHFKAPFMIANPGRKPDRACLLVEPSGERPFIGPGTMLVDIGPALFERWKAAGGQAKGFKQVGETQFQAVDPRRSLLCGITLNPKDRFALIFDFAGTKDAAGNAFVVNAIQTNAQGEDQGGVEYRLSFKG
ncbi:hypothetical protein [Actinocrispum sp. NPDC049592]|uniref:hypothetical protein n=1 Tax=Actinocrispum sp. NPDC049592 TaxID=3154835 RepID=UPI003419FA6C